jgi:hypothetical protein
MVLATFTLAIEIHESVPAFFLALVLIPDLPVRKLSLRSSEIHYVALERFSAKAGVPKMSKK